MSFGERRIDYILHCPRIKNCFLSILSRIAGVGVLGFPISMLGAKIAATTRKRGSKTGIFMQLLAKYTRFVE